MSQFFRSLTFPALTGFRLCHNDFSIHELYGLLRATPALTELHCSLPLHLNGNLGRVVPTGVDPLNIIIPDLKFLVFKISNSDSEFLGSSQWRENLINSSWLNLRSENNRIQSVLFYTGWMVNQNTVDVIEAHLAELSIDNVELRIHRIDIGTASIFDSKFYKTEDFMDWDEDMGFYLEHTTNG